MKLADELHLDIAPEMLKDLSDDISTRFWQSIINLYYSGNCSWCALPRLAFS